MADVDRTDLAVITDIAARLAEQADDLSCADAIGLMVEAEKAYKALHYAIDMLESRAVSTIEQPVTVGKTVFTRKRNVKRRPDQERIAGLVESIAAHPDENGEMPPVFEAVHAATKLMRALYVSPSTEPKVGGVNALGVGMDDVCQEEFMGYTLRRTEIDE